MMNSELDRWGDGVARILILHALIILIIMGLCGIVKRWPNTDIFFWVFVSFETAFIFAFTKIILWYKKELQYSKQENKP